MIRLLLILFLLPSFVKAQAVQKKQLLAVKTEEFPKIDGNLNDPAWAEAPIANDFIQNQINAGAPSYQKTEVKVLYDDVAIYIGAFMHEVSRDSILRELGVRDNEGNTDVFGVFLDTYNDDINAFGFVVTAAGVQIDARYSSEGQDFNWNAVWQSSVELTDSGWVAELKIPYSALRFSKETEQVWGINFIRKIRRTREMSFWNFVDPRVSGLILQSGDLIGLKNIKSPLRLSVTPYVSAYYEHYPYNQHGVKNNTYSLNGGADLKYGINESFTLDLTLVPDFGQVQSDNVVLNLSPFEVKFDERRQFFTEGTELFNKGGIFYSRRIGGQPLGYYNTMFSLAPGDRIVSNPATTPLINAAKLSGRNKNNLGIGVFNATTSETVAVIENAEGSKREIVTQPLTNYNVTVFDQALRNNSYLAFINTNVTRNGSTYDVNVSDVEYKLVDKSNRYAVSGFGTLTQKYFPDSVSLGKSAGIGVSKISGNFQVETGANFIDKRYDINDLGIMFQRNVVQSNLTFRYNIYKPFWKVNNLFTELSSNYARIYEPSLFWNFNIFGAANTTFTKRFLSTGFWTSLEPIKTYDHFEPRVPGRFYLFPTNYNFAYWISSDYRKKFALDVSSNYRFFDEHNRFNFNYSISPRYRASNKLSFVFNHNSMKRNNDVGAALGRFGVVLLPSGESIFGIREVNTKINTFTSNYIFTNRMSLSLRVRHYWSDAIYKSYHILNEDGILENSNYSGNHDINFNAFNVDMVYTWQFAPGSEVIAVWKNAIYTSDSKAISNYFYNVHDVINAPQNNSFSLKVLYYFDYLYLKSRS